MRDGVGRSACADEPETMPSDALVGGQALTLVGRGGFSAVCRGLSQGAGAASLRRCDLDAGAAGAVEAGV